MNTDQIYEMLWNDAAVSSYVMAVIPCNALKYISASAVRGCYIMNCNANSYLRGDVGHWIFLGVHSTDVDVDVGVEVEVEVEVGDRVDLGSSLEVFDPRGESVYNEEICMFMRQFDCCSYNYQYLSKANCGFYTLVYSYYRCRAFNPTSVLNIMEGIGDVKEHCLMLYGRQS